MILTRDIILKEISAGNIEMTPFDQSLLGADSYDLALGNTIRVFTAQGKPYHVSDDADFADITRLVEIKEDGYIMKPGEVILGVTKEKIKLSSHIAGWLEGRSRFARVGLMVHISSPFMQPGIDSHQVLEIANLGPTPLVIFAGTKICQFIFEYCEGEAAYKGKFAGQTTP
ncbi:MAG: dCTP deaminase [Candidatus Pacebacteria bacterium]|nr:dCTP deaminase [Candidatus Paceibacterota bacterium]